MDTATRTHAAVHLVVQPKDGRDGTWVRHARCFDNNVIEPVSVITAVGIIGVRKTIPAWCWDRPRRQSVFTHRRVISVSSVDTKSSFTEQQMQPLPSS